MGHTASPLNHRAEKEVHLRRPSNLHKHILLYGAAVVNAEKPTGYYVEKIHIRM
jgi:hypothetical protein